MNENKSYKNPIVDSESEEAVGISSSDQSDTQASDMPSGAFIVDDDAGMIERSLIFIRNVFFSIIRTTVRYFKNIPHRSIGYIKRKEFEYKRLPKRRTPNRIYQLVGYTTKSYVNRKIRKEQFFSFTRSILLFAIILILIVMLLINVSPLFDLKRYEQIFGISDIDQLTEKDPFNKEDDYGVQAFSTERPSISIETLEDIPLLTSEATTVEESE